MRDPLRLALYVPLVVVAVALALVGVLLVPLRIGGTLIWAAVAVAVVGTAALCATGTWLTRSRAGGFVPLLVWLAVTYGAGLTGPGGDVLVPADSTLGLVPVYFTLLLAGAVAGGVACAGAPWSALRRRSATPRGPERR